jgi:hypothetical protein
VRLFVTAFKQTEFESSSSLIHLSATTHSLNDDFVFSAQSCISVSNQRLKTLSVTVCLWIIARKMALIVANKRFEIASVYQLHFLPREESEAKAFLIEPSSTKDNHDTLELLDQHDHPNQIGWRFFGPAIANHCGGTGRRSGP